MTQSWPAIPDTDTLTDSRPDIVARDESVKSCFSGTSFPATDLLIGMLCFRTDQLKFYQLKSTGPSVWTLIADLAKTLVNVEDLGTAAFVATGTGGSNVPTVTQADARYIQKAGDTVSGAIQQTGKLSYNNNRLRLMAVDGSNNMWFTWTTDDTDLIIGIHRNGANDYDLYVRDGGVTCTVWHTGNDGAGSGMDADLLDGQQGSYYQNANNLNAGTVPNARLPGNALGARTVSTSAPSGGADGDIWYQV